jgi:photosystem II stability/assembly factor-like uncharacterized protein
MLFCFGCTRKKSMTQVPAPAQSAASESAPAVRLQWSDVSTPYPVADITAVGNVFWICGAEEMIASSSDGGNTWQVRHSKPGGDTLLHIAFVNGKVGHATGKDGLLVSTSDGGKSWNMQQTGDEVLAFSFADANNGIVVMGGDPDIVSFVPNWGGPQPMDGVVKMTHDGGQHWQDVTPLKSEELQAFSLTLAVAALDSLHYLVIRRQPTIEDAFVITNDGGKSWHIVHQRNDQTNRELARWVFVHRGEYWAFGMELLNRQQRGGYGFPLAMHSKDGSTWTHGVNGGKEFGGCNPQGCYMWDGVVESLYGLKEQFWNVPQEFSLTNKWAIAGDRACTISSFMECGSAVATNQPQAMRWHVGGGQFDMKPPKIENLPFAEDCKICGVRAIWPDPGFDWQGRVVATLAVAQDGTVTGLSLDGMPDNGFVQGQIRKQIEHWQFEIPKPAQAERKRVELSVKCVDVPDAPAIGGCHLQPTKGKM